MPNNDDESETEGAAVRCGDVLSSATLDRAAWALDYRMRAMAPMLKEAEERRSHELAAALREGAEKDLKAFDEIQEVRARLDSTKDG